MGRREVRWWLEHRSVGRLLVVLTEGEFDAALPAALARRSGFAPRWVDLPWLHDVDQVDQANPRLRECVADVAAAVRGVPKDALVGERIRQHRRTMRLARGAVTALALLLVVASVAAVLAVLRGNDAVDAQHLAIARGMVGQAEALRDRDPAAALRFGIAAQTVDPSPLTRASLAETLLAGPYRATLPAKAAVTSMAVTPDGRFAAVGAPDGSVQVWGLADPGAPAPARVAVRRQPRRGQRDRVRSHGHDDDHRRCRRRGARLRRYRSGCSAGPVGGGRGGPVRGGRALARRAHAGARRRALARHALGRRRPRRRPPAGPPLSGLSDGVQTLALARDGHTLAVGTSDRSVLTWDITDRAQPATPSSPLRAHRDWVTALAFLPDGHHVLSGSRDASVVLWDRDDAPPVPALGGSLATPDVVADLARSADGRLLASAGGDQVLLWDTADRATPRRVGPALTGTGAVPGPPRSGSSVELSQDGWLLVTTGTRPTAPPRACSGTSATRRSPRASASRSRLAATRWRSPRTARCSPWARASARSSCGT